MNAKFAVINSRQSLDSYIQELTEQWLQYKWLMIQTTNEKQRSQLQNNSLHLWLDWLAVELNKKGLDVRYVLNEISKRMEVPWTAGAAKELIWRPVHQAYTGNNSTTRGSTKDYPAVYDILTKHLGQEMGIYVPWPNKRVA